MIYDAMMNGDSMMHSTAPTFKPFSDGVSTVFIVISYAVLVLYYNKDKALGFGPRASQLSPSLPDMHEISSQLLLDALQSIHADNNETHITVNQLSD